MDNDESRYNGLSPDVAATRVRRVGPIRNLATIPDADEDEWTTPLREQNHRNPKFFAANQTKRRRRAAAGRGTRTITVVGDFPNPWKTLKEEISQIKGGRWNPTVDDMEAVSGAKKVTVCPSFLQLLGIIYNNPVGSVQRINIITHGSRTEIAFEGSVKRATGAVFLTTSTSLTANSLGQVAKAPWFEIISGRTKKKVTFKKVLKRFSANAQIFFYACNSGSAGNVQLLQEMANVFRVTVHGFSKYLKFEPKYTQTPLSINRKRIKVAGSSSALVSSVTKLTPDVSKSPKAKPKAKP